MKQPLLAIPLVAVSLSCAPAHAPTPGSEPPRVAAPTPAPTHAPSAEPGLSAAPSGTTVVSVRDGVVYLQDRAVQALPPGELKRVVQLYRAMFNATHTQRDKSYRLSISGELDAAQFKSVTQTAGFAGWSEAVLETRAGDVALHALVPGPPNVIPRGSSLPESVLVLIVRPGAVEVWRTPKATGGLIPSPELAVRVDDERPSGETLSQTLAAVCVDLPCSPAVLYVVNSVPFHAVESALVALAGVTKPAPLEIQLRVQEPGPPGTPPPAASKASGRLAPELIQQVVRAEYGRLRKCYEDGLRSDPELGGTVVVYFTIGRDGTVTGATLTRGTTLKDASVTACVIGVYQSLAFPKPEGGIVTVAYPIAFEKGE